MSETAKRVKAAVQGLEQRAQMQIDENAVPGLAVSVVFEDEVVYV